jgi:hypothetical protein
MKTDLPSPNASTSQASLRGSVSNVTPLEGYQAWTKKEVEPQFDEHDQRALKYQRKYQGALKFVYIASVFAIFVVVAQTLFFPSLPQIIWLEVAIIVSMICVQKIDERGEWHDKWIENRYMGEKLRCAMFTFLVFDRKEFMHMGSMHRSFLARSEIDQKIEKVLDKINFITKPVIDLERNIGLIAGFLSESWLKSQYNYHKRTHKKSEILYARFEKVCLALLFITIAAAIVHAFGIGHHQLQSFGEMPAMTADTTHEGAVHAAFQWNLPNFMVLLAILLPAISAAITAVKHAFEIRKISLRSQQIMVVLEKMMAETAAATDAGQLRHVVAEAEHFFMREHEEWYSLVAHKGLDI